MLINIRERERVRIFFFNSFIFGIYYMHYRFIMTHDKFVARVLVSRSLTGVLIENGGGIKIIFQSIGYPSISG